MKTEFQSMNKIGNEAEFSERFETASLSDRRDIVNEPKFLKENITSLGIPKQRRCPHCGKMIYRSVDERRNMADCMLANCKGLWCVEHCGHCGWVAKIYPTTINHIPCTQDECEKLFEEIKQYENEVDS